MFQTIISLFTSPKNLKRKKTKRNKHSKKRASRASRRIYKMRGG